MSVSELHMSRWFSERQEEREEGSMEKKRERDGGCGVGIHKRCFHSPRCLYLYIQVIQDKLANKYITTTYILFSLDRVD